MSASLTVLQVIQFHGRTTCPTKRRSDTVGYGIRVQEAQTGNPRLRLDMPHRAGGRET
jgi:hypothetical protein